MKKWELEGLVAHYEQIIEQMQEKTFLIEDDDGFLRRWVPPALHPNGLLKNKHSKADQ